MPVQCLDYIKQPNQKGLKLFPCLRDSAASADTKRVGLSLTYAVRIPKIITFVFD
jgi:hypothetical protein